MKDTAWVNMKHYRSILDNMFDGVYLVNQNRMVTYWNRGAEKLTGYSSDEIEGRQCCDLAVFNGYDNCVKDCAHNLALCKDHVREFEGSLKCKDDKILPVLIRSIPIMDNNKQVVGALEIFKDLSPFAEYQEQVLKIARLLTRDTVTELHNESFMEHQISAHLQEFQRFGWSFSVMRITINDFHRIHQSCGSRGSLEMLGVIGKQIQLALRPFDVFGRFGDHDFLAILVNVSANDSRMIHDRISDLVKGLNREMNLPGIYLTVSIGVTCVKALDTVFTLLARAAASREILPS